MRGRGAPSRESALTRAVNSVFAFVRLAEFEILFFLFFFIAFLIFKDLVRSLSLFLDFFGLLLPTGIHAHAYSFYKTGSHGPHPNRPSRGIYFG